MKHEYEAKFLAVDVAGLRAQLAAFGAVQVFPRTLLTRKIFESDVLDGSQWVRLRNEGTRTTLTLKQVTDATSIHGTTEIETEVGDLDAMAEILTNLGLREVRYQENFREEWQLGDVAFDFDTWPDLPTFLEIEGPDEPSVRDAAAHLGLDYSDARFGSVDAIYKSETGRDILAEPTLLFPDAGAGASVGVAGPAPGLVTELTAFMRQYEQATNSHEIDRVVPLIAEDAVYWFSDGSYRGVAEITGAIERTFATIRDEAYGIGDLEWVVLTADHAVCRYRFSWTGIVGGRPRSGAGRGTNVIVKRDGAWKMRHEHLST